MLVIGNAPFDGEPAVRKLEWEPRRSLRIPYELLTQLLRAA